MQLGVFLVLRDGLDTSYARSFLASTNAEGPATGLKAHEISKSGDF